MKYPEVKFPGGKVVYLETTPGLNKVVTVQWMDYHVAGDEPWDPQTFASETYFSWCPGVSGPFAMVHPPNFIERWLGITHAHKIWKQVDRGYKLIEKELKDAEYQLTVKA